MEGVNGFVLAGGRSSRMGSDKALLEVAGETLLARALKTMRAVSDRTFVVGAAAKFACFAPAIEDIYPGRGPLSGIHAVLTASDTDLNLIISVDTPGVTPELLRYLAAQAERGRAAVTVPRIDGGLQPLVAIYAREFRDPAEMALMQGNNKIDSLFHLVQTEIIEEPELLRQGFAPEMFENINTPDDLRRAEARLIAGAKRG